MVERRRTGGWGAVAIFLIIALATIAVLAELLRKTNPSHLTIGAAVVMLLYATVAAFVVLASRLFTARDGDTTAD
jgi:hypothetical protein